ncbi:hypothetical protein [Anaerotardibacter muris]|uniref:hypothetical protein n=1 Tax=Anaerotardibacter muris TaxID=2941505 RepID=UPI00203CD61F|nr:hypothetical protein [Anaerotardibacter muris]
MYKEPTKEQRNKTRNRIITVVVVVCALVIALVIALNVVFSNAREQGAASIRNTILNAAMQCAAIEGSFPTNLSYLEDNYDLRVNHEDYVVIYEVLGSNVLPSIVVVPR